MNINKFIVTEKNGLIQCDWTTSSVNDAKFLLQCSYSNKYRNDETLSIELPAIYRTYTIEDLDVGITFYLRITQLPDLIYRQHWVYHRPVITQPLISGVYKLQNISEHKILEGTVLSLMSSQGNKLFMPRTIVRDPSFVPNHIKERPIPSNKVHIFGYGFRYN